MKLRNIIINKIFRLINICNWNLKLIDKIKLFYSVFNKIFEFYCIYIIFYFKIM